MIFLKRFFAFLILVLPIHISYASNDTLSIEDQPHQIVPRHLFLPMNQDAYEKQPIHIIKQRVKDITGLKYVNVLWKHEHSDSAECHIIFSDPLERPARLYHLKPDETFPALLQNTKTPMRFEKAVNDDIFMWSIQDPNDHKSYQYHLYSLSNATEIPFEYPNGFWKIIFSNHLIPLMAIRRESINHKSFFGIDAQGQILPLFQKTHPITSNTHIFFDDRSNMALYYDVGFIEGDDNAAKVSTTFFAWNPMNQSLVALASEACLDLESSPPLPILSGTTSPFFAIPCHKNGKRDWEMPPGLRLIANKMFKAINKEVQNKPYVLQDLSAIDLNQYTFTLAFDREPDRSGTFNLAEKIITWDENPFPHYKELRLLHDHLSPMEHREIKARDGFIIPTCLTLPKHTQGPFPTILLVHGGPADSVAFRFSRITQILTNRGFATLAPNFRGSTYDVTTAFSGFGDWGRKMQTDLHDVIEWAVKEGIADPKRVGMWGGSYGGYATLLEATSPYTSTTFPRIACASAFCAPVDLTRLSKDFLDELGEENGILHFMDAGFCAHPDERDTAQINKNLAELSPINRASGIRIPLLLGHGVYDSRAPIKHSQDFSKTLKEQSTPHVFYTIEAPHEIEEPKDLGAEWALEEHFFAHHLGVSPEPFGDVLKKSSIKIVEGNDLIPGLKEAVGQ
ncbi:MAG: alpha/beta hydrolase family protein [Candidatus Nucleicultricaceae bacterium]